MAQVNVEINGKTFRMACNDGEEDRVIGLAERVDQVIAQLRDDFGEIGDQRLTVMASIMLADELSEIERQNHELQFERDMLKRSQQTASEETKLERERRKADVAETSLAHQTQLAEVRAAHERECAEITEKIDEMTQRIAILSEKLTSSN